MALSYDYCALVPNVEIDELDVSTGELCSVVTSDFAETGRKQCAGYTTPVLSWAGFDFFTRDLPANLTFSIDVWFGVEERAGAPNCLWIGSEALEVCKPSNNCPIRNGEVAYAAVKEAADAWLSAAKDQNKELADFLVIAGGVFAVGILLAGGAYLLVNALGLSLAGAAAGGAILV